MVPKDERIQKSQPWAVAAMGAEFMVHDFFGSDTKS